MQQECWNENEGGVLDGRGRCEGEAPAHKPTEPLPPTRCAVALEPAHDSGGEQSREDQVGHQAALQAQQHDRGRDPDGTHKPWTTAGSLGEPPKRPREQHGPGQASGHLDRGDKPQAACKLDPGPHPDEKAGWMGVDEYVCVAVEAPGGPGAPPVVGAKWCELTRDIEVALLVENRYCCGQQGGDRSSDESEDESRTQISLSRKAARRGWTTRTTRQSVSSCVQTATANSRSTWFREVFRSVL